MSRESANHPHENVEPTRVERVSHDARVRLSVEAHESMVFAQQARPTGPAAGERVTDPAILNDIGRKADGTPLNPVYLGIMHRESYRGPEGQKLVRIAPAWLAEHAAHAFILANDELRRLGKRIQLESETSNDLNGAGRTATQQRMATGIAAPPGRSRHEHDGAVDVHNYRDPDVVRALLKYGFQHGDNGRPIRGDENHFSFRPGSSRQIAALWSQRERTRVASATPPAVNDSPASTQDIPRIVGAPPPAVNQPEGAIPQAQVPTGGSPFLPEPTQTDQTQTPPPNRAEGPPPELPWPQAERPASGDGDADDQAPPPAEQPRRRGGGGRRRGRGRGRGRRGRGRRGRGRRSGRGRARMMRGGRGRRGRGAGRRRGRGRAVGRRRGRRHGHRRRGRRH